MIGGARLVWAKDISKYQTAILFEISNTGNFYGGVVEVTKVTDVTQHGMSPTMDMRMRWVWCKNYSHQDEFITGGYTRPPLPGEKGEWPTRKLLTVGPGE